MMSAVLKHVYTDYFTKPLGTEVVSMQAGCSQVTQTCSLGTGLDHVQAPSSNDLCILACSVHSSAALEPLVGLIIATAACLAACRLVTSS